MTTDYMNIASGYFNTAASHLSQVPLNPQAIADPAKTEAAQQLPRNYQLISIVALSAIAMTPYSAYANIALCATFIPSLLKLGSVSIHSDQGQQIITSAVKAIYITGLCFLSPAIAPYASLVAQIYTNATTLHNLCLGGALDTNDARFAKKLARFSENLARLCGNVALIAALYFGGPQVIAAALILKGASEIFNGARIAYYSKSYTNSMGGVMLVALGAFRAYSGSVILQDQSQVQPTVQAQE